jgi:hypothetical protein
MSIFKDLVTALNKKKETGAKSMVFPVGEGMTPKQTQVAKATINTAVARQQSDKANSLFGVVVNSIKETPKSFSTQIGQPSLRAYGAVGSAIAMKTGLSKTPLTPTTEFEKNLYGTDKPLTLGSTGKELRGGIGGDKKLKIDPFLGVLAGTLDLIPGGSSADDVAKSLIKIKDLNKAKSMAKTLGLADDMADAIIKVSNQDEALKIVSMASDSAKKALGIGQRGLIKQVLKDPDISQDVKNAVSGNYAVYTDKQAIKDASDLLKLGDDQVYKVVTQGELNKGSTTAGQILFRKMLNEGKTEQALDLLETMAKRATEAGQSNQALSMFSKSTPDGIVAYANRVLKNAKVPQKMTPEFTDDLYKSMGKVIKIEDERERAFEMAKLLKKVTDKVVSNIGKKLSTIQTLSQLISPKTAIRNIIGNTGMAITEGVKNPIAGILDYGTSLLTKKRTTTILPQTKAFTSGFITGGKEGLRDVAAGVNTSRLSTSADLPMLKTFKKGILGKAEKFLDYELRVPDRAFYQATFDASLTSQMKASKIQKPTKEMLEAAHYDGIYSTFQDESVIAKIFTGLKRALNVGQDFGLGDFVLKYPKTPGNILSRGLAYSPAGFVNTVLELGKPLFGKPFNQKRFVDSTARAITGTAGLIGTGAVLHKLGIITGKKSDDFDLQNFEKAIGRGQYKVNVSALKRFIASGFDASAAKIKEGDTLVSYDWMQPAAMGLAIGANYNAESGGSKSWLSTVLNSIKDPTSYLSGIDTLAEQPLIQGLTNPIVYADKDKVLSGAISEVLESVPASFVPQLSNQIRQVTDPTSRDFVEKNEPLKEAFNRVKSKVPGLSTTLPEKIDVRGNTMKIMDKPNIFNVFLNPANVSKFKKDKDISLVLDIMKNTGSTEQVPRQIKRTININNVNVPINGEERAALQKYVGTTTRKIFTSLYDDPVFNNYSDEQKIEYLSNIMTSVSQAGRMEIFGHSVEREPTLTKTIKTNYPYSGKRYNK